jgi:hypothetical protein
MKDGHPNMENMCGYLHHPSVPVADPIVVPVRINMSILEHHRREASVPVASVPVASVPVASVPVTSVPRKRFTNLVNLTRNV